MHCHTHTDQPVARECRSCHHLICAECVVLVGEDALCKSCVAQQLLSRNTYQQAKPQPTVHLHKTTDPQAEAMNTLLHKDEALHRPVKSGFLTVLFSLLPGLGHYYLGLEKRGLNLMLMFFGLIFLVSIVPNVVNFPVGLGFPILWFYSQFDALKFRTLINQGANYRDEPILPQMMRYVNLKYLGWLLALFAVMGIFSNLLDILPIDYTMKAMIKQLTSAFVLLAIGFWILKGKSVPFLPREESEDRNHA
ncbi:hypothetical protein [Tumebacillus permanentifrigoris]|uniref:B box-type domain-containing protein n=1 Tax=Tumebacillus permanentifrigoris TaxID=378543 RepID=A0A316DBY9_9BACL|nr:hypothetical protein [Tumebacillus permanentifrigoris]PWK13743.1 hypothetical protein C7459_10621 [Tumebacillus permanentifrigoris]